MFAKKTKNMLKLSFQGKVVYELPLADVKDGFALGRGKACDWVFPEGDRLVSTKHAVIERRMGGWTLVDAGSKNGVYVLGKKETRVKLVPGATVSVGQCEVTVASAKDNGAVRVAKTQYHRLEVLSGPRKGEWLEIKNTVFRIGSDPSCELSIPDPHISRLHAALTQDERGCFLRPEKTTNPTLVNRGEPAAPGVSRLLRDGDLVSIAVYDFRFLDKHVKHTQSFFWMKIAVAVVTLGILFAAYATYMMVTDSARQLMKQAEKLAEAAQFDEARDVLDKAVHAREFSRYEEKRLTMLRKLADWKRTLAAWEAVKEDLREQKWSAATFKLGAMRLEREVWDWNLSSLEARKQAMAGKNLLVEFANGNALAKENKRPAGRQVAEVRARLLEMGSHPDLAGQPLFVPLVEDAAQICRVLKTALDQSERMERALDGDKLCSLGADLDAVVNDLADLGTSPTPWVQQQVQGVLEPLKRFSDILKTLRANCNHLREMAFAEVVDTAPLLPTIAECAGHQTLGNLRVYLEKMNREILGNKQQLAVMVENMKVGFPPQKPDIIVRALDRERWNQVFQCTIMTQQKEIPKGQRTEPADDYDRLLGIERFYRMLSVLPDPMADMEMANESLLNFDPELLTLRKPVFMQFSTFLAYVGAENTAWLVEGECKLAQLRDFCKQMLVERDNLVKWLFNDAGSMETNPRASIIGRGAALYLAPGNQFGGAEREALAADFRKFRTKTKELSDSSPSPFSPRDAEIRNQVLKEGLPGDPEVRRRWSQVQ